MGTTTITITVSTDDEGVHTVAVEQPARDGWLAERLEALTKGRPGSLAHHAAERAAAAGWVRQATTGTDVRFSYASGTHEATLYLDGKQLTSHTARQRPFAMTVPGAKPGSVNRVRYPFATIGKSGVDQVIDAFTEAVDTGTL